MRAYKVPLSIVLGIMAAAYGCTSAPVHYLTLVPPPPPALGNTGCEPARVPVIVVHLPAQIDQPELVVRQADGSLRILEQTRWIAPLADDMRTALEIALAHECANGAEVDRGRVSIDVQRLETVPGQYVLLEASWSFGVRNPQPQQIVCSSFIRIPVATGYAAVGRGHQQAVATLARQLAAAAQRLRAGENSCAAPR